MSDVSVVGLGEMGGALARALINAGKSVTVWNRSEAKSTALVALGAKAPVNTAEAIAASPVVIICLSSYAASLDVLQQPGVADVMKGRLVVQLSSGTPGHARSLDSWVRAKGARYLDGAIAAWPRQIGGPEASIIGAGPEADFALAEPLLRVLAGNVSYVGANIGHAAAITNAAMAYFAGHWIGFAQGAAISEAEGIDPATFGEMLSGIGSMFADDMLKMGRAIADNRFDNAEATIKTITGDLGWLAEYAGDLGTDTAFPQLAADTFRRARDSGFGAEQHSAVVKVLRSPKPAA